MSLPRINLVVVGHKDHGKSTLIGRLLYDSGAIQEQKLREIRSELESGKKKFELAYILDSLEEERTGGLTIDIVQTPFKSGKYLYTIIDCPGHKEFIQKMLTGASQADAAILVVSAKEGVEPQTREHLFLIQTLGIRQLVVVLNKMDAVGYSEESYRKFSGELNDLLSTLGYSDVPIVPVSAFQGDNVTRASSKLDWYGKGALIQILDSVVKPAPPLSMMPMRCFVQDIYKASDGDIVVCKIETGLLRVDQAVKVMPTAGEAVISRMESFGKKITEATAGDSIGIVLSGANTVKRGFVLVDPQENPKTTRQFTAECVIFSDFSLLVRDNVTIRLGTSDIICKVKEILHKLDPVRLVVSEEGSQQLDKGEVGRVLFETNEPTYLETFSDVPQLGRFVVLGRRGSVAAGIVLERK